MSPQQVREAVVAFAVAVSDAYTRGEDVPVLGGDCIVELGTVAGALDEGSSVDLIYIDLDGDLNSPATGDGVLDWMGLAHILGIDGVELRLADGSPGHRCCHHKLCTFSQPTCSPSLSGALFSNSTFPRSHRRRQNRPGRSRRPPPHVGLGIRPHPDPHGYRCAAHPDFPIAHEVREAPGLTIDEMHLLASRVRQIPQWAGLTLCEVNPDHATDVAGSWSHSFATPSSTCPEARKRVRLRELGMGRMPGGSELADQAYGPSLLSPPTLAKPVICRWRCRWRTRK
jgi:arginase